jgi:hypothetical protein
MSIPTVVPGSLSPEAKRAVDTKLLEGAWSGRALLKLMAELENWDMTVEARKSKIDKAFYGSIIGTFAGFILMIFIISGTGIVPLGVAVFVVPFVLIFVFKKKLNALRAADLPDELRKSLRPVLKQLGQDLHPEEKIKGKINLAGIDDKRCKLKKDLPPGRNRSLKLSVYEEELCDLRLPLADGSTAVLRLDNSIRKLERSYKTTRGKIKSKTKWKKASTVTAMLVPPERVNWEPGRMQAFLDKTNEKLSFVEKNGVMVARLDRYYKFKSAGEAPAETVPSGDIVKLFVRLMGMRPVIAGGAR